MYKALVVDDEALIREGIARVLREQCPRFSEVYEAKDGEEAFNVALESAPDLVITDIQMPAMGGMELIEQLKAENPDIAIIIVSGYDDFDYARRGLKLAVKDYLLKPIDSGQLVARLNQLADELDQMHVFRKDQAELQRIVAESMPLYRERLYRDLIEGSKDEAWQRARALRLGIPMERRYYAASIVRFDMDESVAGSDPYVETLILDIVRGTASRAVSELDVHGFFAKDREMVLIIGADEPTKEKSFAAMNQYLARLGFALEKNLNRNAMSIALGGIGGALTELADSYRQAREAMLFRLSVKNRVVLNFEELGTLSIPETNGSQSIDRLLLHVKLLEEEQARRHVREFIEKTASEGTHPHWVKLSLLELAIALLRGLEEAKVGIDAVLRNKELDPYANVYRLETASELRQWLEGFVTQCIREMERSKTNKGASHVEKVKQYIESRIADSQLSLSDVAANLFLSPNYLRQLFRQETGESFVEYVTRVRMEKAATLLQDPILKIHDVAEKTGFMEQRYFSSCFKKFYQMTPTEYREALSEGLV